MSEWKCESYVEDTHYADMALWWHERQFPATPSFLLPKSGLVMSYNLELICAGFMYATDGKIALLDHIVSDPKSDKSLRSEGLDILLLNLEEIARSSGYKAISAASNHPALIERYEKLGFRVYDQGVTHLAKEI
jgi:hypothetical protein